MATKRKQFTLDEVMSYVLESGSESEMSELEDSEDEDYAPEVADRLEEDVELHVERGENTEASGNNKGVGKLKMTMILNILQMLMVMMWMPK